MPALLWLLTQGASTTATSTNGTSPAPIFMIS